MSTTDPSDTSSTDQQPVTHAELVERVRLLEQLAQRLLDHMEHDTRGNLLAQRNSPAQVAERQRVRIDSEARDQRRREAEQQRRDHAASVNREKAERIAREITTAPGHLANVRPEEQQHCVSDHLRTARPVDPEGSKSWEDTAHKPGRVSVPEDGCCYFCCPIGQPAHKHMVTRHQEMNSFY